jgi:tetratricopeptide (TPR) repeat protein
VWRRHSHGRCPNDLSAIPRHLPARAPHPVRIRPASQTGTRYRRPPGLAVSQQHRLALPEQRRLRHLLARSYADLARVLYHQGRYAEAEPLARWALTARENHPKSTTESIFQSLYVLGVIERAQKHYSEARSHIHRALDLQEKAVSHDHPILATTIEELALINSEDGHDAEAEKLYKRALAIREKQNLPDDLDLADTADAFAQLLIHMKRPVEANPWQDKARNIRDTLAEKQRRAAESRAAQGLRGFK